MNFFYLQIYHCILVNNVTTLNLYFLVLLGLHGGDWLGVLIAAGGGFGWGCAENVVVEITGVKSCCHC